MINASINAVECKALLGKNKTKLMQIYYNLSQQKNGQEQCLGKYLHPIRMTGTIKHLSLKERYTSEDCICVKLSNI